MRVFDFDRAIVREPGRSVVHGLRHDSGPLPDYDALATEHAAYVAALCAAGVTVEVLPPLEDFPDSVFVEDPALVFPGVAILLRPGAATRIGEATKLEPVLVRHFDDVRHLDTGHVDGGDVLVTPDIVLIGLSSRTDATGAAALIEMLSAIGRTALAVSPPPGALHLKTAVSLLDEETILTTAAGAASGLFARFRQLAVPEGEAAAANALRVNDRVFVGSGFPATIDLLDRSGYDVVALDTTQIGLLDAGLSCMSLRWRDG